MSVASRSSPASELFAQPVAPGCRASVVVPARNEQASLAETLDALRLQVDLDGNALPLDSYEVLLLLNNCTDASRAVAERYRQTHPRLRLYLAEQSFPPERAHVGTARRLLMDEACRRLEHSGNAVTAILSTDADTLVAPDWIARNLAHIEAGSEAVGGVIHLFPRDLAALDPHTRAAYERDRTLQRLVAEFEAYLDPDPADPWPRHLEHFGASLACTPEVYRRAGGMPAIKPLEDVAFVDALRKAGARLRHAPDVHIHTSARLDGRAEIGLSGQLRHWRREGEAGIPHMVESAEWLTHRFGSLATLRRLNASQPLGNLDVFPPTWHPALTARHGERLSTPRFLELLDCNRLIEETFTGSTRHAEIHAVCERLESLLRTLRTSASRRTTGWQLSG